MTKTRPVLRWPGSKTRLAPKILPLVKEHVCYCDVFAGGLGMLMSKPRSKVEIVNDLNNDLVALYRNMQFHLPALLDELDWLFASRKNIKDFVSQPGLTELQRAARFLLRNRTSFGGKGTTFGVSKTKGGGVGFDHPAVKGLLGNARERLNGVVVENLPYERCLANYDSAETLFFLDPPYLNAPTGAYEGFTEAQMKELRERVGGLKAQWILTVDDSPLNRDLWKDCNVRSVVSQNRLCNNRTHSDARFGELIITPN